MNGTTLFTLVGKIAIDANGAAQVIDATVTKAGAAADALNSAGKAGNDFGKSIGSNSKLGAGTVWLGNTLTKLTSAAASFGKRLVSSGFDYNSQMEQLTTSFATKMNGDTEAAAGLVEELQQLAKVTPMETLGLAKTANLLMGYGTAAEDVIDVLTMLGDVAGGSQETLDHLALAYGQAMGAGKLNAQDANQMIQAGVPVWKMLADYINEAALEVKTFEDETKKLEDPSFEPEAFVPYSIADIREMAASGEITAETLTDVFRAATSEGGRYYKAMEVQSKTYAGQLSTMSDLADQAKGALTKPFFEVASSSVFPSLTTLFEEFSTWCIENKDQLSELATTAGDFVVNSLTAILDLFKWITENGESFNAMLLLLAGGFTAISIAVNPLHGIFLALCEVALLCIANWDKIKGTWENITKAIDGAIISLQTFFGINSGSTTHTFEGENGPVSMGGGGGQFGLVDPYANSANADPSWDGTPGGFWGYPEAKGLDYVPYDEFPAILHKGEAVLTATEAAVWRNGGGMGDTSRLEGMMAQLLGVMNQVVANTGRGQSIVLDSGVLVGQIAGQMDVQLGTMASKKGRGIG